MERPWLSVIMPTYNGGAFLRSSLDSVLVQANDGMEIIAVDDGSTDATVSILESYRDQLPIRFYQRGRIGSWVANTNFGLQQAQGTYVCFLHQDDLWLEGRLSALKSKVDESSATVLFVHPSWFIDAQNRRLGRWRCPLTEGIALEPSVVQERLLVQNFIAMPAPLFSREAALQVGGLDETLWYTADWDFWLKLSGVGKTVYLPQALSAFRIHADSQTVTRSDRGSDFREQLEIVLERHLKGRESVGSRGRLTSRVARFSVEVNIALAAVAHGQKANLLPLFRRMCWLGPTGWHRYLRDSRIVERVLARQRLTVARH